MPAKTTSTSKGAASATDASSFPTTPPTNHQLKTAAASSCLSFASGASVISSVNTVSYVSLPVGVYGATAIGQGGALAGNSAADNGANGVAATSAKKLPPRTSLAWYSWSFMMGCAVCWMGGEGHGKLLRRSFTAPPDAYPRPFFAR